MERVRGLVSGVLLCSSLFLFAMAAYSGDDSAGEAADEKTRCAQTLEGVIGGDEVADAVDTEVEISLEEHSLFDLATSDRDRNLGLNHPLSLLGAYQYERAVFEQDGVAVIPHPMIPGQQLVVPKLFVEGPEASGGLRVIRQDRALHQFYEAIVAMSEGDRSGRTLIIFLGPPGTGKSESAKIVVNGNQHYARTIDDLFRYKIEWIGEMLKNIPELRPFLKFSKDDEGNSVFHPIPCPLHDTPFAILPEDLQNVLTGEIAPEVLERLGVQPKPVKKPCPHCSALREGVLAHHARAVGKANLSNRDIVEALNPYVRIRRHVPVEVNPVIEDQGRDPNWGAIFAEMNPANFFTLGPAHPFSHFLDGQLPHANGSVVIFEEVFNNTAEFLKKLQRAIEDRVVSQGGSPDIPLDVVMLAASNDQSLESKIGELRAFVDRVVIVRMDWPTRPHDVAAISLYMKAAGNLRAQRLLSTEDALTEDAALEEKWEVGTGEEFDELFPHPVPNEPVLGTDGRFNLWYGRGDREVHISPHAIMHMSLVAASTRIKTDPDPKELQALGNSGIVSSDVFRNIRTRLQAYMGLLGENELNRSQAEALLEASDALREGTFGISARAVGRWLQLAIAMARRPGADHCVTPQIMRDAFHLLLRDKNKMRWPDVETKLRWGQLEHGIAEQFLLPAVQEDLNVVFGVDDETVDSFAREFLQQLLVLADDPEAKNYTPTGESREVAIDKSVHEAVENIYKARYSVDLPKEDLVQFIKMKQEAGESLDLGKVNPRLREAVKAYLIQDLNRRLPQTMEERLELHPQVNRLMGLHQGYCPHCREAALDLMKGRHAYQGSLPPEPPAEEAK